MRGGKLFFPGIKSLSGMGGRCNREENLGFGTVSERGRGVSQNKHTWQGATIGDGVIEGVDRKAFP